MEGEGGGEVADHFEKYGDILEAFIISYKLTGRSKGYGFVTFKEADAAKKACEDPTPIINSRRANCNLPSSARAAPGYMHTLLDIKLRVLRKRETGAKEELLILLVTSIC